MPLETATYISDLVTSNPAASDSLNNADDHMRLIKGVLKNSFPNFDAALASTAPAIDASVSATVNGISVLNDSGARFKTNTKDGIENPSAGKVSIVAQDAAGTPVKQTVAEFTGADKKLKVLGPLQVVGSITGLGSVSVGATLLWWDTALPAEGGYCWANGGTLSRTDAPILWARWGTKFGAGDGSTTFNVPNLCEVVPVGNSTMGGVAARGIITNFTSTLLTTIGGWYGAAAHILTTGQMPKHKHNNTVGETPHAHSAPAQGSFSSYQGGGNSFYTGAGPSSTGPATVGVSITNVDAGNDEAHPNVQPSAVVNWIIRIG